MWYDAPPAHDERDARCLNRNATTQINDFSALYKEAKKSKNPDFKIAANKLRAQLENFNGFLIGKIQSYHIKHQHHIVMAMSKLQKIILDYPKFETRTENYVNEKEEIGKKRRGRLDNDPGNAGNNVNDDAENDKNLPNGVSSASERQNNKKLSAESQAKLADANKNNANG